MLKLAATNSRQVISIIRPQMSEFFIADVLNDVEGDVVQLVVNVFNTATSNVNRLHHRLPHPLHDIFCVTLFFCLTSKFSVLDKS